MTEELAHPKDNSKTVGIIGALGVGRAHAIAVLKSEHKLLWVMDTNVAELTRGYATGQRVVNSWGGFYESAPLNHVIRLYHDHTKIEALAETDIVIVATPDVTHDAYVGWLLNNPDFKGIILCEKPYKSEISDPRVFVGYQWLCHDSLGLKIQAVLGHRGQNPLSLAMWHSEGSQSWRENTPYVVLHDLGCHMIALALAEYGYSTKRVDQKHSAIIEATGGGTDYVNFRMVLSPNDRMVKCAYNITVAYSPKASCIDTIHGWPTHSNGEPLPTNEGEIFVGTPSIGFSQPFWTRAFTAQLEYLARERNIATSKLGIAVDKIIVAVEKSLGNGRGVTISI